MQKAQQRIELTKGMEVQEEEGRRYSEWKVTDRNSEGLEWNGKKWSEGKEWRGREGRSEGNSCSCVGNGRGK